MKRLRDYTDEYELFIMTIKKHQNIIKNIYN